MVCNCYGYLCLEDALGVYFGMLFWGERLFVIFTLVVWWLTWFAMISL